MKKKMRNKINEMHKSGRVGVVQGAVRVRFVACFVVLGVLLALLFFSACSPASEQKPVVEPERDIVIMGLKSGIFGFHPWMGNYETSTMGVNFNIFNSLVEFDPNYKVLPALAESWENPDSLTWRFHLRHGVKFHNGDIFNAEDVKYTLDRIKNDENSVLRDLLASVTSVNVIDEYTVDIKTDQPFPIMLNKLVDIFIASKEYQTSPGVEEKQWPIGTGAYRLFEYLPGDQIVLERFDDYWGGAPQIKKAVFKVITNDNERVNALLAKQIDFAEFVPAERVQEISENEDFHVVTFPTTRVIFMSFDFRDKGSYGFPDGKNPFTDVRVRKAIYYAIDEEKIIKDIMKGVAEPASQFVVPSVFGHDPSIMRPSYDLEAAKALMKEAGYEEGFSVTFDCSNDRYVNDEAICREIARQLKDININVIVNAQPKAIFFPQLDVHNTSMYMMGWATDTGDGGEIFDYMLNTYTPGGKGSYNHGFYSNPKVDELGEKSSRVIDPAERLRIMQEGFRIAMDDAVWVPLHIQDSIYGFAADIEWTPRMDSEIKLEYVKIR